NEVAVKLRRQNLLAAHGVSPPCATTPNAGPSRRRTSSRARSARATRSSPRSSAPIRTSKSTVLRASASHTHNSTSTTPPGKMCSARTQISLTRSPPRCAGSQSPPAHPHGAGHALGIGVILHLPLRLLLVEQRGQGGGDVYV